MKTLRLVCLTCLVLLPAAGAQVFSSFESCPPGPFAGCGGGEPWASGGGTVTTVPSGGLSGPVSGFPTHGGQWCVVDSDGSGGGLNVPGGGPAPYPFSPGATGRLVMPLFIPAAPGPGGTMISFDWNFMAPECSQSPVYNDFLSVDLVSGGVSVLNLLYVDTWNAAMMPTAVSPNGYGTVVTSFCPTPGTLEMSPIGAPKSVAVAIPPNLWGTAVTLEVHVGNGGDAAFPSWAYIDNLSIFGGIPADYQVNRPVADASINNVQGTAFTPAQVTIPGGQPGILRISSTNYGVPWELAVGSNPLVPASGGGVLLPDGQILNLDVFDPTITLLWGGLGAGPPLLGIQELPFTFNGPLAASMQGVIVDPGSVVGIAVTQGIRLVVNALIPCAITITDTPAAFIPQGRLTTAAAGSPGNSVTFTATVTAGGPRKIRFILENVSDEPGVCMNYGTESDTDKDLKFIQSATVNPAATFDAPAANGQTIQTKNAVMTATVTVTCYDWGAFGRINACCLNFVGTACETNSTVRRIPLDANTNSIADGAAQNTGPGAGAGAADDTDNTPAGEGTAGDHLSRYQEYRGFIVLSGANAVHVRTDVTRKDVFIRDADTLGPGDFTSANLTTDVRWVNTSYMDANRRINFKASSHTLATQQTAIVVTNGGALGAAGVWGSTSCTGAYVPNNLNHCRVFPANIQANGATLTAAAAMNAAVVTVNSTAGYVTAGRLKVGAATFNYTGKTATTFTGCTAHAALANGASVKNFSDDADFIARVFAHEAGHAVELDHTPMPEINCSTALNTGGNIMSEFSCPGSVSGTHYWHVFVGAGAAPNNVNAIAGEFRVKP